MNKCSGSSRLCQTMPLLQQKKYSKEVRLLKSSTQNELWEYNLSSQKKVSVDLESITNGDYLYFSGYVFDNCFLIERTVPADRTENGEVEYHQFIINFSNSETPITEVHLLDNRQKPIYVLAETQDKLCCILGYSNQMVAIADDSGTIHEETLFLPQIGLISKNDYLKSIPNYQVSDK